MKTKMVALIMVIMGLALNAAHAQEELANGQIRAEIAGVGVSEPGFFILSGGVGASARMWKYFALNGAISYGQRDFPVVGGTFERGITHFSLSVDLYPAQTYRGFYLGGFVSYSQMSLDVEDGLSPAILLSEPDNYTAMGFQIGFNAKLADQVHLFTKLSLGLEFANGSGLYTGVLGVGYTFL